MISWSANSSKRGRFSMSVTRTPSVANKFVLTLLPLWASYLARVYAWIVILQDGGTLSWTFHKLGLGSPNIGYSNTAMWIVFSASDGAQRQTADSSRRRSWALAAFLPRAVAP